VSLQSSSSPELRKTKVIKLDFSEPYSNPITDAFSKAIKKLTDYGASPKNS